MLCKWPGLTSYYKDEQHSFYNCPNCFGLSRDPKTFLSTTAEKARYLTHNNDVNDPGYQKFVAPLVDQVTQHFNADSSIGLDYGAGTGPVIAKLLEEKAYNIALYDPFFHPNKKVLDTQYNFIVCCEVMEHFYDPYSEFKKLRALLLAGGKLICKTDLYATDLDFGNWYYKNDPSHVFIYHRNTLSWIQEHFGFATLTLNNRTLVLGL